MAEADPAAAAAAAASAAEDLVAAVLASATASGSGDATGVGATSGEGSPGRDDVVERARGLLRSMVQARPHPSASVLNTLASILEDEEARYQQKTGYPHNSNSRSSHTIGRILLLIRDDDDVYDMLSTNLILEGPTATRAAAARVLLACVSCWTYPYAFDEPVLAMIKQLVVEDLEEACSEGSSVKRRNNSKLKPRDTEVLKTYALGLFAAALAGSDIVEEVLTSGLPAKLMRYVRIRVLGESAECEYGYGGEGKINIHKGRDETRVRFRQPLDAVDIRGPMLDADKTDNDGGSILDNGKRIDDHIVDEDDPAAFDAGISTYEDGSVEDWLGDEKRRKKERNEGKSRSSANHSREDGFDDMGRAETSRKKNDIRDRGGGRSRGKPRVGDGVVDNEKGSRKDKGRLKVDQSLEIATGPTTAEMEDMTKVYMAGKLDISLFARRAVSAAQQEAKTANAPDEAVKAAGDAAAELVKAAGLEALATTNDEEAALAAAEAAAATVVDAASSISRKEAAAAQDPAAIEQEGNDSLADENEVDEHVLDSESLAFLKARFCVQCLEKLGEYLEVLGPVLQERGVDVCLALLQRHSHDSASVKDMAMVSDVLKLVCALAAHRKFAAVLVDRGGVQQLLKTPRVPQTYVGISLCLFAVASLQGVMERVCALPPSVVQDAVALAFQLLECPQDAARRNAALFFGASFVFRAVIDAFDSQDGLRKLLNLLRSTVALRSGGSSSTLSSGLAPGVPRIDRGSSAEVLTSSDKQIAYHACVALRQYFRSHFLLLVDSLRPCKGHRGASRSTSNSRASYKPLDVSNEAIEAVIQQLSRDRKLGTAFVRAKWPALENFMNYNGHLILLELTQAAPGERYLHEIAQHALVVLQIVTLVPSTRRMVVNSTLSNERPGMAVILDAASGAAFVDPEVIQSALLVLVNLVCPPPAFSSRSTQAPAGSITPLPASHVVNGHSHANSEAKERSVRGDDKVEGAASSISMSSPASALVGDSRISLGPGSGGPGLAAYMEQVYRLAREAVRANNGIKVLLHLLYPRTVLPPSAHDCIRALACRVLLGLARDEAIAQILTKLQVGKLLSELLRDGSQANRQGSAGGDQDRWQAELSQVALDLIGIVTNAGRANTVASEAAAPTLRRIERAAIAAATPINYHSRELLQLIHEHLLASGLTSTASALLKEAQLMPLPSVLPVASLPYSYAEAQTEPQKFEIQWPVSGGAFLGYKQGNDEDRMGIENSARKRNGSKALVTPRKVPTAKESRPLDAVDSHSLGSVRIINAEIQDNTFRTPALSRILPAKRKASDRDVLPSSPVKRAHLSDPLGASPMLVTPTLRFRNNCVPDSPAGSPLTPGQQDVALKIWGGQTGTGAEKMDGLTETPVNAEHLTSFPQSTPSHSLQSILLAEPKASQNERATLDSLVVQYLKHQHRQCPVPITTLPPLSLLHSHTCPEPSRALYAPYNTTARLGVREIIPQYGGLHGRRHNRHFIYSRFRPVRTCRDDAVLLTCATFLGQGSLATGSHSGDIRLFDINQGGNVLETHPGHSTPISFLQSVPCSGKDFAKSTGKLMLSSASYDVRLWSSASLAAGALHTFENCKAARFNHAGSMFGALTAENPQKEVLLYDVSTYTLRQTLSDGSIGGAMLSRGQAQPIVHFSPSDVLVLWSGVLWDHRIPRAIHRFDQFTDYGGGGFHPAGNEVIINSEVWDLRTFKLLRSVPSLDQTVISFNATGDVIYATLRRNTEDITAALHHRRARHPLFSAFRTMDAVDYSDIATTQVDRCVLDLATEPSDSLIAVVAMDGNEVMDSFTRIYEVGRRRPTDDDSDPDDGMETDEEEDESDGEDDDGDLHLDDGDTDIDLISNDDGDEDEEADNEVDEDFGNTDDDDAGIGGGILEILSDGEDDDRSSFSSGDEGSDAEFGDGEFNGVLQGFL